MSVFRIKTIPAYRQAGSSQKTGLIFIGVGLFCFLLITSLHIYRYYQQRILSFETIPQLTRGSQESLYPTRIVINRLKIDLPVAISVIKAGIWEISDIGASYLVGSGIPGKNGNVVIYGHNKKNLFGPILWLKSGDEIQINSSEQEFRYLVTEVRNVTPAQVEVLLPSKEATLTLYTCNGLFDSKRFVVSARLQEE